MSIPSKLLPLPYCPPNPNTNPKFRFLNPKRPLYCQPKTLQIQCAKRTGKQRYPSEKKKLKLKHKALTHVNDKFQGIWRLSKLGVPLHLDPGKDFLDVSEGLLQEIAKVLKFPVASMLPPEAFLVVRKSFDARKVLKEPKFVYTVEMDVHKLLTLEPRTWDFISRLEPKVGLIEHIEHMRGSSGDLVSITRDYKINKSAESIKGESIYKEGSDDFPGSRRPKVAVVGSGPSGLFACLVLAELGVDVTIIERGQAVEQRGRDIGALMVRRILQLESNFCFGEGGAGTWSDGKLVTRIGRNSGSVLAVGLRIEHPQELINSIQYSSLAAEVHKGRGKVPVADYKVVKYLQGEDGDTSFDSGATSRSCYSFCMCPGGQVVLTSTNPSEICINGMSFSRRASRWANAALVATVSSKDFGALNCDGPLAGVEFQREFERRAAMMGGGNFVVPVQTVTDFMENKLSVTSVPPSSYRLGVKAANLHELFPLHITKALQHSISMFDEELPGFISKDALLHGVETRTSSPIQIPRNSDTYESTSLRGLYPIGEGAGYAGGIVSAAVDGMYAGFAVAKSLGLYSGDIESILGKAQYGGWAKY
ncbi:uncharacterized protein LOC100249260 isoform X2 [Vitis vinifera]|uniref:uncharacterized protein LOC100249260 isoform X2 n=1 Tax=Vitis vinifera TaxID=29760 RepID=UPI0008FEB848|nr:uncharacterized protein LOC100249260 isoform X2 [Vitis vinifera]|eukprot:XP_019082241.1 PREDICTED: uncharacterized protein LOC100249260 isoform X2 [Vitis vinifera]